MIDKTTETKDRYAVMNKQVKRLTGIAWFAYQIANARDGDGILANEVRVSDNFLKEMRKACGVKK